MKQVVHFIFIQIRCGSTLYVWLCWFIDEITVVVTGQSLKGTYSTVHDLSV